MTELQEEMAESNVATQEPIVAEEKPQIDESKSSAATQEPIVAEEKPQIDEPEISAATQEPIVAEEKPQIDEPERIRKLFIGGLSFQTTTQALKDFYSKFGNVVDCFVAINKETGQPRGYGFVTMSSKAGVDTAMSNRPHVIDAKTVDPKRAVPRNQPNASTKRLFVTEINSQHTQSQLADYFRKFGNVVELPVDKQSGKLRDFAFVTFDDYDPVDCCIQEKSHLINGVRCYAKKSLSRDELARFEQKNRNRVMRGRDGFSGSEQQSRGRDSFSGFEQQSRGRGGFAGDQMRGKGRGFGEVRHDYQIPYGVYGVQPAEFPNFSQQSNRGNASNDYVDPYAASNVYGSWQSNQGNAHQDYVDPYDTSGQDVYGSWQSNQENAHQDYVDPYDTSGQDVYGSWQSNQENVSNDYGDPSSNFSQYNVYGSWQSNQGGGSTNYQQYPPNQKK